MYENLKKKESFSFFFRLPLDLDLDLFLNENQFINQKNYLKKKFDLVKYKNNKKE